MAVSSISCSLKPPSPVKEASARLQPPPPATGTPWSGGLRRACVAAAASVVIATAGAGGDAALAWDGAAVPRIAGDDAVAVDARAPPRWSDRRECPPWRANSLENIVPENLPRPSARRRFNSIRAPDRAPALAPEAVAPFLAQHSGLGCFSL
ncbi:hypothetical protein PAHAL_3G170800 [Panicum hallii]|uniref:Uncharacterized protein n=1 Tax=Panicum hallii TaxID=206008 RepID=A0A2S3H9C8_9POAL|nr:uncharacterized protein LOC112884195 [Panicum hallii]PAN17996.1 hypothetical protein PAHAL_3G170800 [Panicum hallii]